MSVSRIEQRKKLAEQIIDLLKVQSLRIGTIANKLGVSIGRVDVVTGQMADIYEDENAYLHLRGDK